MRLSLDTNILIYGVDPDAGEKHHIASALIHKSCNADTILTLQSLAEFFHVATRKRRVPADVAEQSVDDWRHVFPVVAAIESDLSTATAAVRQHALSFWDAMLWATVRRAGCTLLLTEDFQDGRELGGVRFVNPLAAANRRVLDAALPADH